MHEKVILVSVDGMRPDGIAASGDSYLLQLAAQGSSCLDASTIMPSVTLPCHSSLFFSVDAQRHGITTNTWTPMVRPIPSLADVVAQAGGVTGMFYNWEQLRDLSAPGTMDMSYYERLRGFDQDPLASDRSVTDHCIAFLAEKQPDFVFLYLGVTDEAGHKCGWMSQPYLDAIANASACIRRVQEAAGDGYHLIITADHGGHDRIHGTDCPEDMTIPIIFYGARFEAGKKLQGVSIKDIAPTVAELMQLRRPADWEGVSVL